MFGRLLLHLTESNRQQASDLSVVSKEKLSPGLSAMAAAGNPSTPSSRRKCIGASICASCSENLSMHKPPLSVMKRLRIVNRESKQALSALKVMGSAP